MRDMRWWCVGRSERCQWRSGWLERTGWHGGRVLRGNGLGGCGCGRGGWGGQGERRKGNWPHHRWRGIHVVQYVRAQGKRGWVEWGQASQHLEADKRACVWKASGSKKASTWTAAAQSCNVVSEGFFAARRVAFAASPMWL